MFNVINTIYFQIDKKIRSLCNRWKNFPEMLRHQLYECTSDKIEIKTGLLLKLCSVQTLRMEKGSDIQLLVDDKMGNFKIAPLLILPIVEMHLNMYRIF